MPLKPPTNPACIQCLAERRKRFGDEAAMCTCFFIKDDVLEGEPVDGFTEEEKDQLRDLKDPVRWAQKVLNITPRWYQELMLRCTATRKTFRCGRRTGKCLAGDTYIHLADGSRQKIKNLVGDNIDIISFDGKKAFIQKAICSKNVNKRSYKIILSSGREIVASHDHPFLLYGPTWKQCHELKIKDRVATERKGFFGNDVMLKEEIEFLAFIIGDGCCANDTVSFTNINPIILKRFFELGQFFNCDIKKVDISYFVRRKLGTSKRNKSIEFLKKYGVMGKLSKNKVIPPEIFKLKKQLLALFLNRLFSTDGWASVNTCNNRGEVGYCSASKELVRGVQELLFKFGIQSYLKFKKAVCNGKQFPAWQLSLTNKESINIFYKEIGILGKEKALKEAKQASDALLGGPEFTGKGQTDTIPKTVWELVRKLVGSRYTQDILGSIRIRPNSSPSRYKVRKIGELLNNQKLIDDASADVIWDNIIAIKDVGVIETYDVSILNQPNYDLQNFSAEGIFVHNTIAMAIKAMHFAFTNSNKKVLIVAPEEIMIHEIFDQFVKWEGTCPQIAASKAKYVKDTITWTLRNGSRIRGLTAGTKSGMAASSVRGQEADLIILDEADRLSNADITTIMSLLIHTNEYSDDIKEFIAASTPTGLDTKFREWCSKPRFKEFHFPSSLIPGWNTQMEAEARDEHSAPNEYEHEILADFGSAEAGLYPKQWLYRAQELADMFYGNTLGWDYESQLPKAGCVYTMGVDWNDKKNGVQIVVMEYDTSYVTPEDHKAGIRGRFRIAYRVGIGGTEFTQNQSMEKIIELNRIWQPKAIYVDDGFGRTQIEDLRRYGMAHPESKMLERLKPKNMSTMHEIHDPATKQIVKKHMKPFMVNNSRSFFEKNLIILNRSDKDLFKELGNYTIDHQTIDGRPVYKGKDHILDAFNFSLLAFTMEFTDLGEPIYTARMRVGGRFGEKSGSTPDNEEPGYISVIDKTGEGNKRSLIAGPRVIPIDNKSWFRAHKLWDRGKYNSKQFTRPTRRVI
jgi:replicative DNA helicase